MNLEANLVVLGHEVEHGQVGHRGVRYVPHVAPALDDRGGIARAAAHRDRRGNARGIPLLAEDIDRDLARRQRGYGRGGRMKIETDRVEIVGGVRGGETLGSPIAMSIENRDHQSWLDRMCARARSRHAGAAHAPAPRPRRSRRRTEVRPPRFARHLERASARETAARTAVGAVAASSSGGSASTYSRTSSRSAMSKWTRLARLAPRAPRPAREHPTSPAPTPTPRPDEGRHPRRFARRRHARRRLRGRSRRESPPGLGSHVQWDRKLDGRLAQALVSIQAIKAVEIGDGWAAARRTGSRVHDPIHYDAASMPSPARQPRRRPRRRASRTARPSCAARR